MTNEEKLKLFGLIPEKQNYTNLIREKTYSYNDLYNQQNVQNNIQNSNANYMLKETPNYNNYNNNLNEVYDNSEFDFEISVSSSFDDEYEQELKRIKEEERKRFQKTNVNEVKQQPKVLKKEDAEYLKTDDRVITVEEFNRMSIRDAIYLLEGFNVPVNKQQLQLLLS